MQMEQPVRKEFQVLPDLQDHKVFLELQARMEPQDHKEFRALQDHQDFRVFPGLQV